MTERKEPDGGGAGTGRPADPAADPAGVSPFAGALKSDPSSTAREAEDLYGDAKRREVEEAQANRRKAERRLDGSDAGTVPGEDMHGRSGPD